MKQINGLSLFSNVGISETYFKDFNVDIKVANELLPERSKFYSHIYNDVNMINGDITNEEIYNNIIEQAKLNNCNFLIATPPCQGMSQAGKMKQDDVRNKLIMNVVKVIKDILPDNIIIENVPNILKFYINVDGKDIKVVEYIESNLKPLGYFVNYKVLDSADYNTPQYRKRAIFLISRLNKWEFPEKNKHISVRDVIGNLPSLESGEKSNIKYHYAKKHNDNHILWMKNTPTGKTAFDNDKFYPQKDGRPIRGFKTTYKRIEWDRPAPTITMCNGAVSSQNNVHPGRELSNGIYSDARVLTPLELFRIMGLPDSWNVPEWATENLVRKVIGEAFPPKFSAALLETMPK
tara:strand:- start:1013 stop:2059 length:1047 start_codon:yes stop_codon:yes gene_type:complete